MSPNVAMSTAPRTRQLVFVQRDRSAGIHSAPGDRQCHREHCELGRAALPLDARPAAPWRAPSGRGHERRQRAGTVRVRPEGGGYDDLREISTFSYATRLYLRRAGRGAVPNLARGGVGSLSTPNCDLPGI